MTRRHGNFVMLCEKIRLEEHVDKDGKLVCLDYCNAFVFPVKRVFYVMNVPLGGIRGMHAALNARFCFHMIQGKARLILKNNKIFEIYELDSSYCIVTESMTWIEIDSFDDDAILLVLSDKEYSRCDYVNSFTDYLNIVNGDF